MSVIRPIHLKKTKIFYSLLLLIFVFNINRLYAQDFYRGERSAWLQKAEESKPVLIETIKQPASLVTLVKDENAFQHWKAVKSNPVDSFTIIHLKKNPELWLILVNI